MRTDGLDFASVASIGTQKGRVELLVRLWTKLNLHWCPADFCGGMMSPEH